jgi:hypothetical protein
MNIISYGGGVNSTAMIIGLSERVTIHRILFSDTGGEYPHTYAFIDMFGAWLAAHGLPDITMVHCIDKTGARLTLEDECLSSCTLPSIAYGYKKCSLKHKIAPQDKACNNDPNCKADWASGRRVHKYIGYDAGETRRIEHAAPIDVMNRKYENHYPLYEWAWSRAECEAAIARAGLPIPKKSSCFYCPSAKKKEIQSLWEDYPHLFERAVTIERNAAANLTKLKGLGRSWSWESYRAAFMRAKAFEGEQLTFDDFIDPQGGCICGAPCGCYDG